MSSLVLKLLIVILGLISIGLMFMFMIPPPEVKPPHVPPQEYVPPPTTPERQPSTIVTPDGTTRPATNAITPPSSNDQSSIPDVQTPDVTPPRVTPQLPFWNWQRIAAKANAKGHLYAVQMDDKSGLGVSPMPGVRMTIGAGSIFDVVRYRPDFDDYPKESLDHRPMGQPLPEDIVDPYALLQRLKEAYPSGIVLNVNLRMFDKVQVSHEGPELAFDEPRALYQVDIDRNGDGDYALLYVCASTGVDMTAEFADLAMHKK